MDRDILAIVSYWIDNKICMTLSGNCNQGVTLTHLAKSWHYAISVSAAKLTWAGDMQHFNCVVVIAAAESLDEILKHWIWLEEEMLPVLGILYLLTCVVCTCLHIILIKSVVTHKYKKES